MINIIFLKGYSSSNSLIWIVLRKSGYFPNIISLLSTCLVAFILKLEFNYYY